MHASAHPCSSALRYVTWLSGPCIRSCPRSPARIPSGSTPSRNERFASCGEPLRVVKYRALKSVATWPSYNVFCQCVIDLAGKWSLIFAYMLSQASAALPYDSVDRPVRVILCRMKNLLFCMFFALSAFCQLVHD